METESKLSLVEGFSRFFSIELAETRSQLLEVYKIRFRVYCEEFKYESPEFFPDGLETDEYDEISQHCIITHRETGLPAGCVRLVPARGDREICPLPYEKHCWGSIDKGLIDGMSLDRTTVCEISRLAVDGIFRRRTGEALSRFGEVYGFTADEQRTFSLIAVAGFLSATVLTEKENRTNVFAMMEPFLPRLMKRSGIIFQRVGKDIDYHGIRAPYFITTQSALDNMNTELSELYYLIRENMIN